MYVLHLFLASFLSRSNLLMHSFESYGNAVHFGNQAEDVLSMWMYVHFECRGTRHWRFFLRYLWRFLIVDRPTAQPTPDLTTPSSPPFSSSTLRPPFTLHCFCFRSRSCLRPVHAAGSPTLIHSPTTLCKEANRTCAARVLITSFNPSVPHIWPTTRYATPTSRELSSAPPPLQLEMGKPNQ